MLKKLRKQAKLRQDDLVRRLWPGKSLDVGRVQISRYERGVQTPREDVQEQLARALGCQVGDFFEDSQGQGSAEAIEPGLAMDQAQDLVGMAPDFETWAGEQMMEIAKRALAAVKVLTKERDALLAKLAARDREVEVLRAEVNRLVNGDRTINPLAADQPAAAGPTPGKDPSKYLLNDSSGGRGGDPGVV